MDSDGVNADEWGLLDGERMDAWEVGSRSCGGVVVPDYMGYSSGLTPRHG